MFIEKITYAFWAEDALVALGVYNGYRGANIPVF